MTHILCRVEVDRVTGRASRVIARSRDGEETVYEADAVIFSVGVTGKNLTAAPVTACLGAVCRRTVVCCKAQASVSGLTVRSRVPS